MNRSWRRRTKCHRHRPHQRPRATLRPRHHPRPLRRARKRATSESGTRLRSLLFSLLPNASSRSYSRPKQKRPICGRSGFHYGGHAPGRSTGRHHLYDCQHPAVILPRLAQTHPAHVQCWSLTRLVFSRDRPLGEGEAAFLSLVMQAANSEPIDDMSTEPTASLPDQLLESFIVRYGALHSNLSFFFLELFCYPSPNSVVWWLLAVLMR